MKGYISKILVITSILIQVSFSQSIDVQPRGFQKVSKGELKKFRDIEFGSTMQKVKSKEKAEYIDKTKDELEEVLMYNGKIQAMDCIIYYAFIDNKFLNGLYQFNEKHTNDNLYIDDYKGVLNSLKEKYGEPDIEDEIWSNDLYKKDRDEWGFAISLGHLQLTAEWHFDNGYIKTVLKGDNYSISHFVMYTLNEYFDKRIKIEGSSNEL